MGFSPISNPSDCPWGEKALDRYLGDGKAAWQDYDASLLLASKTHSVPLLVEQGTKDEFLHEQLKPQCLVHAAQQSAKEPSKQREQTAAQKQKKKNPEYTKR